MKRPSGGLTVLFYTFLLLLWCDTYGNSVTRIMPLGDSITRGWYGSVYDWGYRKPLYDLLTSNDYNFDFVGRKSDGIFEDPVHEGRDGWKADEILNGRVSAPAEGRLADWLITDQPDVILLHIGTNDIRFGDQNASEVSGILDVIDAYEVQYNKHITVILALIINQTPPISATTIFNNSVEAMALNRIANGDDIIIVNMEPALNYSTDMADTFHPNDYGYAKMAAVWYDALSQCNCVNRNTVAIAGRVLEADGNTPVEGLIVKTETNDVQAVTDGNGFYALTVQKSWSGVIVPEKDGYDFEPNGYVFNEVEQDYTDANYTAVPKTYKIKGHVVDINGITPISDVNVSAEGGGGNWCNKNGLGSTLTDSNGYYEIYVDFNWSGQVKLSKDKYIITPQARSYTNVNEDLSAQDYSAIELTYSISGYVKNECNNAPAEVVLYSSNPGRYWYIDTYPTGYYEIWVSENWSGYVEIYGANAAFTPPSRIYNNVTSDIADQNYILENIYDLDCSGSLGLYDIDIFVDNWLLNGSGIKGDFYQDEYIDFKDWAKFVEAWLIEFSELAS